MNAFRRVLSRQAAYQSAIVTGQANWILVKRGSPQSLLQAISAYGDLYPAPMPQPCTIILAQSTPNFFELRFPDRVPAYSFLNLIGWLHRPPGISGVTGAIGWYRSLGTGIKYALYPDPANPWGDTLLGYNTQGQAVSVYLPDTSLCEVTRRVRIEREPVLGPVNEQGRVTVTFNTDPTVGNFNFVLTHARDYQWK